MTHAARDIARAAGSSSRHLNVGFGPLSLRSALGSSGTNIAEICPPPATLYTAVTVHRD